MEEKWVSGKGSRSSEFVLAWRGLVSGFGSWKLPSFISIYHEYKICTSTGLYSQKISLTTPSLSRCRCILTDALSLCLRPTPKTWCLAGSSDLANVFPHLIRRLLCNRLKRSTHRFVRLITKLLANQLILPFELPRLGMTHSEFLLNKTVRVGLGLKRWAG